MLDLTASSCPRCGAALSSSDSSAGLCPACLLLTALPSTDGTRDVVSTLAPGTDIGPFRIVRMLGRGGMATVYEAVEDQLERSIALKVLPPEFLHEPTFARRFEQEARVVARLEHQHIVPIFATGIDEGIPWMSTRLMAGGSLAARLETGAFEPADALRVLRHVAAALDYAHGRGIVHRDVKPANILLDAAGDVYLADFGLALMLEGGTRLSQGVLTGTPCYMSPEQALSRPADHRSDIYSLGIVAYEMLTGSVPFSADSPIAVLLKHVNEPLPVPAGNTLPPGVLRALHKAMAKEREERCASAGAFVADLERAFKAAPRLQSMTARNAFVREFEERTSKWVAVAGGAFVTATLLVAFVPWRQPRLDTAPATAAPAGLRDSQDGATSVPATTVARPALRSETAAETITQAVPKVSDPEPADVRTDDSEEPRTEPSGNSPQAESPSPSADAVADHPPPPPVEDRFVKAEIIEKVPPIYPAILAAASIEGTVVLAATVDADGTVSNVRVVRSDDSRLNQTARTAVMKYRFRPASRNGVAEPSTVEVAVEFVLDRRPR